MIQALSVKALQEELSGLSPVLAWIPGSMALVTIMIVILHVAVNAEDLTEGQSLGKAFQSWLKKLADMLRNKS